MTRNAAAVSTPKDAFAAKTVYGATFDHLIPPGRALTGVVRDKRTGRPLAGVGVGGTGTNARTTTDAEGRYTLTGFPKGKSYGLMVMAGDRPPYFVTCLSVPDTAGLDPLRADVECVPGIPMRLKLIDKETGQAPKGVEVAYWPLNPNPHVREVPGYRAGAGQRGVQRGGPAGRWDLSPGRPARPRGRGRPHGRGTGTGRPASIPRPSSRSRRRRHRPGHGSTAIGIASIIAVGEGVGGLPQSQFSAIVLVNPPDDSGPITAEAVLERDRKREVRVLGPDGEPLAGVTAEGEGAEADQDARRDDRLGAQPDAAQAIRLPPRRPQARRLPAGAGRRGRAVHGPAAALGHDRRPAGRCAGPAAAQGPPDEHRLAGRA